jgi:acyl-CoA reductase-like NAD-dependent aldehyde dehydrogenase
VGSCRAWGRTTPVERAELLLKITDAVEAEAEEFARLECENVGKPITFAREEMPWVYDVMRFSAGAATDLHHIGDAIWWVPRVRLRQGAVGARPRRVLPVQACDGQATVTP